MKTFLILTVAVAVCFSAYASSENFRSGVWAAELQDDQLQMTLFGPTNHPDRGMGMMGTMGFDVPLQALSGLSKSDLSSSAANVQFELRRAAGTVTFDGRVANGTGAGHFRFTPNDAFVREMDDLGYHGFRDDQMLMFAIQDFVPQAIRDLRAMGYEPTQREVEEIAIFRVTPDYLREMSSLGYPKLSLREAVNFRVGRVDAAYIKQMHELGYTNLSARQLADMAILGVNPKFISELKALGYDNLTARQLTDMRAMGVTPEYIRKLTAKGYSKVPVDKLIQLRAMRADEILFK